MSHSTHNAPCDPTDVSQFEEGPWRDLATFPAPFNAEAANASSLNRYNSAASMSSVMGPNDEPSLIAGRFRLDEAIGEGTWGEVMKGVDTATKENIAAKATRHGSAVAVESLVREFLAYCALSHFRGRDLPCDGDGLQTSMHSSRSSDHEHAEDSRVLVTSVDAVVGVAQVLHFESTVPPQGLDWSRPDGRIDPQSQTTAPSACLVQRMLGPSLEQLRLYCLGCFDKATVLMIADQAVGRLEHVHRSGMIHRDLKPENFLMGVGATAHVLHLIDFGLATTYRQGVSLFDLATDSSSTLAANAPHVSESSNAGVAGTQRYASPSAMKGHQQSRRDDLQALAYCLVFLATGCLPWQGMMETGKANAVIEMKESTSPSELCSRCPYLIDFVRSVFALKFSETPSYGSLRYDLRKKMAEDRIRYDFAYCWAKKRLDEIHRGMGK
eukprot:CAMPEP_0174832776 /NCGR_PEP_ID=MMETSP1114-20130205/3850_1 /TAXON_ID=312471 /ORGANISM="Neobodo designis, Strain CCAP 1951/1" /LENGTH=439 /DNA_ID=CAMNT_0016066643 /DNA_START=29 /DNA_END=1348 /DNA_ORIENTATION=-